MNLTLIGTARTRAFRPLWLLEELGVDFTHKPAPPRAPEVQSQNPSGKVPVLIAGERIISDSTAILTYLADSHGRFTASAGTLERAEQDAALHSALDEMDAVLWTAARHSFVLPKDKRLPAIKDSLKWEFGVTMGRLEAHLNDRTFVAGEAFSIADIVTAHCLRWAGNAGFPLPEGPLTTYRDRMYARPAAQRALARD